MGDELGFTSNTKMLDKCTFKNNPSDLVCSAGFVIYEQSGCKIYCHEGSNKINHAMKGHTIYFHLPLFDVYYLFRNIILMKCVIYVLGTNRI